MGVGTSLETTNCGQPSPSLNRRWMPRYLHCVVVLHHDRYIQAHTLRTMRRISLLSALPPVITCHNRLANRHQPPPRKTHSNIADNTLAAQQPWSGPSLHPSQLLIHQERRIR